MVHIGIALHLNDRTGADLAAWENVELFRTMGARVTVISPSVTEENIRSSGMICLACRQTWWVYSGGGRRWLGRLAKFPNLMKDAIAMSRAIRRDQIDLVVTNTICSPVPGIAAWLTGRPHLWFVHEVGKEDHGMKYMCGFKLARRFIHHLSDRVVVNGEYLASLYNIRGSPCHVVPYVISTARDGEGAVRQILSKPGRNRLLIIGEVAESKGQHLAIEAISELVERGHDLNLKILGRVRDRAYKEALTRRVVDLGLSEIIHFSGWSSDPFKHYPNADLVLMCSRNEAFGRVTVEAMKCGCLVIGSNRGCTPYLLEGGRGLLFRTGDVASLVRQIDRAITDPEWARSVASSGQDWAVNSFTRARSARALYEAVPGPIRVRLCEPHE